MNRAEQHEFVRDLTKTIRDGVLRDIAEGAVPETWDGLELRQLLADRFEASVFPMDRSRKRAYLNEAMTRNL